MSIELMMIQDAANDGKPYRRFVELWVDLCRRQHIVWPSGMTADQKENFHNAMRQSAEDAWTLWKFGPQPKYQG